MKHHESLVTMEEVEEIGLPVWEALELIMRETGLPAGKYEFVKDEAWRVWRIERRGE